MEVRVHHPEFSTWEDRKFTILRAIDKFKHQSGEIIRECRRRAEYENKRDRAKRKQKEADYQRMESKRQREARQL